MNTSTDNLDEVQEDAQASEQASVTGIISESVSMQSKYSASIMNIYGLVEKVEDEMKEDDIISCPKCGTIPDETSHGSIKCKNEKCNFVYNIISSLSPRITKFINIPKERDQEYKDLIAHISNFIILGNYIKADEFCDRAIDFNPSTPQAWEFKAYCAYFLTTNKQFIINTGAEGIMRYLMVAKSNYNSEEELNTIGSFKLITERIADRIFDKIKHRIFLARQHNKDLEKRRFEISKLIYSFRTCHRIHPYKSIYLETILSMYLGHDEESWINLEIDESESKGYKLIDNTHEGRLFELLGVFTKLIQQREKEYTLSEMKGGNFGDPPKLISEIFIEKRNEYEKLKEIEKQEMIEKERFEKELGFRFRQENP